MDMQDVDYELIYESGKDEQDPLDFLSRHSLPITGSGNTERIIKCIIEAEHAIILGHIREETAKDKQLRNCTKESRKKTGRNIRKTNTSTHITVYKKSCMLQMVLSSDSIK